jgi:hypothetical protein
MGNHSVGPVVGITLTDVGRCLLKTVARAVPKVFNNVPMGWVARLRIFGNAAFGFSDFVVWPITSAVPASRRSNTNPNDKNKALFLISFFILSVTSFPFYKFSMVGIPRELHFIKDRSIHPFFFL